jgi:hypothetical protein
VTSGCDRCDHGREHHLNDGIVSDTVPTSDRQIGLFLAAFVLDDVRGAL